MEVQKLVPRTRPFSDVFIKQTARVEMSTVIITIIIIIIIISHSTILTSFALEYFPWQSPWDCFSLFLIIYSLFELQPRAGPFLQVPG